MTKSSLPDDSGHHHGVAVTVQNLPWQQRAEFGRGRRAEVPRSDHSRWKPRADRGDPLELVEHTNTDRLPDLVPIRYGRMALSPFSFFRGAAVVMAADLADTPTTGIYTQICGDCHAQNFGWFASPERHLMFDINDFDETLPGAWEWDVKRLSASLAIVARQQGANRRSQRDVVVHAVESYRRRITDFSRLPTLELWYAKLDERHLLEAARSASHRETLASIAHDARRRTVASLMPRLTLREQGRLRIVDRPPLIFHGKNSATFAHEISTLFSTYGETLPEERRQLLNRFQIVDVAYKVVGVGAVGLRCGITLMADSDEQTLFLQFKEARPSVLEPYFGGSTFPHQGHRVVAGQRLMQAHSDLFLGWITDGEGRQYYVRQMRDMKTGVDLETMKVAEIEFYGELCGWALARAHAKLGSGAEIAGYLGDNDNFDHAVAKFAVNYADQNESDHEALLKAIQQGRIDAQTELDHRGEL